MSVSVTRRYVSPKSTKNATTTAVKATPGINYFLTLGNNNDAVLEILNKMDGLSMIAFTSTCKKFYELRKIVNKEGNWYHYAIRQLAEKVWPAMFCNFESTWKLPQENITDDIRDYIGCEDTKWFSKRLQSPKFAATYSESAFRLATSRGKLSLRRMFTRYVNRRNLMVHACQISNLNLIFDLIDSENEVKSNASIGMKRKVEAESLDDVAFQTCHDEGNQYLAGFFMLRGGCDKRKERNLTGTYEKNSGFHRGSEYVEWKTSKRKTPHVELKSYETKVKIEAFQSLACFPHIGEEYWDSMLGIENYDTDMSVTFIHQREGQALVDSWINQMDELRTQHRGKDEALYRTALIEAMNKETQSSYEHFLETVNKPQL
jgi:hypothetical protein